MLTINAHDIGKAFASLNSKVPGHIYGPDHVHAFRLACFLSEVLAGVLKGAVQRILLRAESSAMGMSDNLEIPTDQLDKKWCS